MTQAALVRLVSPESEADSEFRWIDLDQIFAGGLARLKPYLG